MAGTNYTNIPCDQQNDSHALRREAFNCLWRAAVHSYSGCPDESVWPRTRTNPSDFSKANDHLFSAWAHIAARDATCFAFLTSFRAYPLRRSRSIVTTSGIFQML